MTGTQFDFVYDEMRPAVGNALQQRWEVPYVTVASNGGRYRLDPAEASDPTAEVLAALLNDSPVQNAAHAAQQLDVAHAAAGPHEAPR